MSLPTVTAETPTEARTDGPKWFGQLVDTHFGSLDKIAPLLPLFKRRPFGLGSEPQAGESSSGIKAKGENKFWDLIVRVPISADEIETPVGVVSKRYRLVQHRGLFEKALEAIKGANIKPEEVTAQVALSPYGSRMLLSFILPDRLGYNPGDDQKVALRFVCINSVDGTCRLTIMMGWYRLVCENGLIVGTSRINQRLIHNEFLELPNLAEILRDGISLAEKEKSAYREWIRTPVSAEQLTSWVDGPLCKKWGVLAAARTYLICQSGRDGQFTTPFEKASPHRKRMKITAQVPGAPQKATNAYSVCQALAWIAKERRDLKDQVDGMREIPDLMKRLTHATPRRSKAAEGALREPEPRDLLT
jgi:Domain of unknown function (DUF932)